MKPVKKLLIEHMTGQWADPFAGENSPAQIRNDIRSEAKAEFTGDALEFLKARKNPIDGILFDPPYSVEQCLRKYTPIQAGTAGRAEYWAKCKDEIARILKPEGKAICFGWDSTGIGIKRGFELLEILLICHGACHNDTIVTVEQRVG